MTVKNTFLLRIACHLLLFCLLPDILVTSCNYRHKEYKNTELASPQKPLPYHFDQPTKKYFLHEDLEEVSGLSWFGPNRVACVQDESGQVFIYNLETKKMEARYKFGKSGDYEGIEVVDNTIYVLRSDGTLFYFPLRAGQESTILKEDSVRQFQMSVPGEKDVEGLGYDPHRNRLLLAFKTKVDAEGKRTDDKPIYAVSLTDTLADDYLAWTVTEKRMEQFVQQYEAGGEAEDEPKNGKDRKKGKDPEKRKKGDIIFKPSGIAVHPVSRQIYLIASEGKKLVILSQQGEIEGVVRLSPRMLKQPEGICFAPNGDLYIASEGRGEDGFILKFAYQKPASVR